MSNIKIFKCWPDLPWVVAYANHDMVKVHPDHRLGARLGNPDEVRSLQTKQAARHVKMPFKKSAAEQARQADRVLTAETRPPARP